MKIFRQTGWYRPFCILLVIWSVFAFIIISFLRYEPDINISNRISQAMKQLHFLQKRESEMLNLLIEFSSG